MKRMDEVLIVDDEPRIRSLLRRFIEKFGPPVRTEVASTAREARAYLLAHRPRLVVLDWGLGDASGAELAREIAEDPRLSRTRILGISGLHRPGLNDGFFRRGASEFLRKPFSPREFVGCVQRLLA